MGSSAIWGFVLMGLVWCASTTTIIHEALDDLPYVTCSEAMSTMEPRFQFLGGWGSDEPSTRCCLAGLRLTEMCSTAENRKAVCGCFRDTKLQTPILLHIVELLRQACIKDLPISSDHTQDCARIR